MKRSEKPLATLVVKEEAGITIKRAPAKGITVAQASIPVRILVPHGCKAEIFSVPEGTEILIRYSSKVAPPKPAKRELNELSGYAYPPVQGTGYPVD